MTAVQMLRLVLNAETVANMALIYVVRTSIPTIWGGCSGLTLFSHIFLQDVKGIFFAGRGATPFLAFKLIGYAKR